MGAQQYDGLTGQAYHFVMDLLENNLPKQYLFHAPAHTLRVLGNSERIGAECRLDPVEMEILRISALFHDTGYVFSRHHHEAESIRVAGGFLETAGAPGPLVDMVLDAVRATEVPQRPADRVAEVLCDADLMHLAADDYFEQMELLRLEWGNLGIHDYTEYQFHIQSVDFFARHRFHSEYGRNVLTPLKQEVLRQVMDRIRFLEGKS